MASPINEFDAAKAVVDQLSSLDKEQQRRILRWVAESLGLEAVPPGVQTHRSAPAYPSEQSQPSEGSDRRSPDLKTFVDSKSPKSDVQFAAVIAYYYQFEAPVDRRAEAIDANLLKEAARLARRRRPPSAIATLNNAKQLGYLDTVGRGQFRLNSIGENLVAMTLPTASAESPPKSKRK